MQSIEQVKAILADALSLGERAATLAANTRLLGSLPELDSMAVVSVITAIEDHFGIVFEDDDINADVFETVGTLSAVIERKCMQ
ncbi:acyl carrier protein [Noviherbaspirillum autotrophicum]|uniref:Acyl carrier protein n=1 Tax=Noviherbaspirillum autotrophicum TaxID=709839 RepID=A0A0C1Y454_9BURK|nr:acyl carrier protein [Noviherbaspirillum autotrophicum]KIF81848.1 acyl carrier protein [Noviherbaspirillum autotrophicum]